MVKGNALVCMILLLSAISILAGIGLHLYFTDPIPETTHYYEVRK